jgi:hypothetical protein
MPDTPKAKYVISEEQKERYAKQRRERYATEKTQLKKYHAKSKEERQQYYQDNKEKIIKRVKEWYKTKKEMEAKKDLEIDYLRELVNELQDE